jgi:capsular exopolysaccharide synthesis family protein
LEVAAVIKQIEGTGPSGAVREPHLRDYLRILYGRRWVLIATLFLTTAAALVCVLVQTPIYQAKCTMLLQPTRARIVDTKEVYDPTFGASSGNQIMRREFLETQYLLILSEPNLEYTFGTMGFAEMPEFAEAREPIKSFSKLFNVVGLRNSYLADVTFDWKDPELARKTLECLIDQYVRACRERSLGVTESGLAALKLKKEDLRAKVEAKSEELQDFMTTHNMVSLEQGQDIVVERLKEISRTHTAAETGRIQAESRLENIRTSLQKDLAPEDLPEVVANDTVRDVKLEYVRVKLLASDLAGSLGENHPQLKAANATLQTIRENLQREVQNVLASAEADYTRARQQEDLLAKTLSDEEKCVMDLNRVSARYNLLKDAHATLTQEFNGVTQRIGEIEIALAAGSSEDGVFPDPVKTPISPIKPQRARTVGLAGILGIFLGATLCFFVEYFDTSVKTKEDVESLLSASVLGYVPSFKGQNGHAKDVTNFELLPLEHPRSSVAESFRSIRTALSFTRMGIQCHQFVVTSAVPSEGKTIVSANVAIALAQSGHRVLLVDADLRKPRVHKVFKISGEKGLSNLLASDGELSLSESLNTTSIPNLWIIPSGPVPPNPSELLGNPRMADLVSQVATRFDCVVYDTPPAVNVTDSAVLARQVSGALLVVRSFSTDRAMASRAGEFLAQAGARLLGVVLNGVDAPKGAYEYYNYYRDYYDGDGNGNGDGKRTSKRRQTADT